MTESSRIRILPDLLVRKIAAGEVVERPASVLKELLENAIDAGGERIAVTIEEGGKRLIRVTDDGCGMSPDELRLAVAPHATSKIAAEADLAAIATMGFRGEALASISAVSKLRIVSRRAGSIEGHEIRVAADALETSQAAGCPEGTTVEVRDLFFNVPARRKFLRTNATETGHCNDQLTRATLSNPHVAFTVTNNGRKTLNLPRCDAVADRIESAYGAELAAALLHVQREERGITLDAYAAPPAQSRATAQWQFTFVNGRYIRDRFIQHAIKESYRGLTEPHRHGVVFLFLTMDPALVDVNVHPTKIEVRFAEPRLIHSQVLSALRETFQRADLTPALRTDRAAAPVSEAEQDRIRRDAAEAMKAMTPVRSDGAAVRTFGDAGHGAYGEPSVGGDRIARSGAGPIPDRPNRPGLSSADPMQAWRSLYGPPRNTDAAEPTPLGSPRPGDDAEQPAPRRRAMQVHNLYLVAETEDGIVIVDQHALHERVIYEQLRRRITAGPLQSQRLLLPETVEVTAGQAALIETHADLFTQLGIELTAFGTDAVAVQSFPTLLKDTDVLSFMRDLFDFLERQAASTSPDAVVDHVLSMMACKAAVKAGDPLTPDEIDALFDKRDLIDKAGSCPHGRPTTLRLTRADLDRQFHRT